MIIDDYFIYFLIYSFIGWFWEVMLILVREHKFVNRGFLNGPYCPIYGAGALLFLGMSHYITNPVLCFFIGGLLACTLEYITSFVMEKLFHARWWDYSKRKFNINGRVCLIGYVVFGAGAVGIHYLHPLIVSLINRVPYLEIWAAAASILFIVDIIVTNQSFIRFDKILREYQNILKKGRIINFISTKSRRFVTTIQKQQHKLFTYQQRRLMRAFPNFKSHYDKAYAEVKKLYANTFTRKKR